MRVYAYAVLALREGNAWRRGEYDAFFAEMGNERFLVGDGDGETVEFEVSLRGGGLEVGGASGEEVQRDGPPGLGPSTSGLPRRTTAGMQEGRTPANGFEISAVGESQFLRV